MEFTFENNSGLNINIIVNGGIVDTINDGETAKVELEDGDTFSIEEPEDDND